MSHEIAGARRLSAPRARTRVALISDAMPPAAGGPKVYFIDGRRVDAGRGARLTLDDGTLAGAAITMMDAVRYRRARWARRSPTR